MQNCIIDNQWKQKDIQSFVVDAQSSKVKSSEKDSESKQLGRDFILTEEETEPQRKTTTAWNSKTKMKLR